MKFQKGNAFAFKKGNTIGTGNRFKEGNTLSRGHHVPNPFPKGNMAAQIHGMEGTPTFYTWASMIQRTTNPNAAGWKDYGGRGIICCDRWLESFVAFLIDMGPRPEGMSIDRINPDGNYEPGNCRWATSKEQRNNQRSAINRPQQTIQR